jgi:hypothetical protein
MKNILCFIVCFVCLVAAGVWWVPARVWGDDGASSAKLETIKDVEKSSSFVWMHDLKKARIKAKAEKKPLFVMFRCEP